MLPSDFLSLVVEYLASNPKVEKVNHPSLPDHPDHALYEKYFPNFVSALNQSGSPKTFVKCKAGIQYNLGKKYDIIVKVKEGS